MRAVRFLGESLIATSQLLRGRARYRPTDLFLTIDECGAPEFFSNGSKLLVAPSVGGKLLPAAVRAIATNRSDIHFPKPRVVTITQSTETGQPYSIEELRALSAV